MPITSLSTTNGAVALLTSEQMLVALGKGFVVTEPTLGTGVAYALQTATSATANGFLMISNNNTTASGTNIYLDRLTITETAAAPTGTLRMTFEAINEQGIVAMTGNVATRTPVNLNTAFTNATGATVQFFSGGAATVPAAVKTRNTLAEIHIDTGVAVQHDTYVIDFGVDSSTIGTAGLTAARAAAPATISTVAPALMVAPQTTTWLNMYWVTAATNVPSFTYQLTYFEV